MTAKSAAQRQEALRQRRLTQGLKLVRNLWAHEDDHAAIKALAAKLARKRAKEKT